jgi:hypothetical protein
MRLRVGSPLLLGECEYENPLAKVSVHPVARGSCLDRNFAGVGTLEEYPTSGI